MPQGLQIWDKDGKLVLDLSDRVGILVGSAITGISNGSLVDNRLLLGDPFWDCSPIGTSGGLFSPTISVTGNTLSWTFLTSVNRKSCRITYGVR